MAREGKGYFRPVFRTSVKYSAPGENNMIGASATVAALIVMIIAARVQGSGAMLLKYEPMT